jgi:hypothetical protein
MKHILIISLIIALDSDVFFGFSTDIKGRGQPHEFAENA